MWHYEINIKALDAAEHLSNCPNMAFLDSAMKHEKLGRYSYIAIDPFATFSIRQGIAYWNECALDASPLTAFRQQLARYKCDFSKHPIPFQGGCIGYIAYELAQQFENLSPPEQDFALCDELSFHFYDILFAFDHMKEQAWIFSSGFPENDWDKRKKRAKKRYEEALSWLKIKTPPDTIGKRENETPIIWRSNFSPQSYQDAVECVKEHIISGDIYQANIAQRFSATLPDNFNSWHFYKTLRATNPATFSAFINFGPLNLASSSPERFLRLLNGNVETRPIKGTAKRSKDKKADQKAAENLTQSEKDYAENVMIVDLLRNDLSRACSPGSIDVPSLCQLESYASVHHLVSAVTGRLNEDFDALDLLQACFPGGSITGVPKLRAMDIITEIEKTTREVYCGAIGYISFDGNMDVNIAIRTVILHDHQAVFQAGGGITLLSDPKEEYKETLAKAQRIFDAFAHLYPANSNTILEPECS